MTSTPEADQRLLDARDLALAALHEITPASTVGPPAGHQVEADGSVSLTFENRLAGYPGWYWTVTVARVDDADPTVLEVELLPGDGALIAPDWVPWAERLAEYRAHQAELAEQAAAQGDDEDEGADLDDDDEALDDEDADEESDDEEEFDDDSDEEAVAPRLHAGDVDGVDIDELDESADDEDDEDSADDADDEDDEGPQGDEAGDSEEE
ncbi:DUF3027 domain-containing protein [Microbacterium resistens]|uniref:DUF3027 domain-containing protein n=1 Tax=Microbacterium resistens TaxID=156977 RepID=UPI001C58CB55|nr:DUF3027 domain-containing protein [Microbacterium resistens]MBW1638163.1 DUF3027 domain-containing protein [Microbacterium resistens]